MLVLTQGTTCGQSHVNDSFGCIERMVLDHIGFSLSILDGIVLSYCSVSLFESLPPLSPSLFSFHLIDFINTARVVPSQRTSFSSSFVPQILSNDHGLFHHLLRGDPERYALWAHRE